ncbi:MAG: EAL domain-containing protein [Treponema sp.]|nr:EAL domain-containing protein [Treponema sp.]
MLWMHIALLNFVYEYWGERFSRKRLRKVVFPIAIIDTVSLCVNIFTQHMFSMLYVPWKSVPYQFQPHFFIVLHFAFLMFLISAAFIHYLSNFITCSRLYAERYIVLFCGLSVIVLAELYSLIMHPASDCVIMAYIGYGILVALYSTFQERSQVTNRMLSQVVSQISDAVVFLDVNGDCVYINDSAARLLNVTQKELKLAKNKLIRFMESDEQWSTETYKRTRNFIQDSVEYSYETEFHRVYDSNGVYSGGFICIRDRSEDARRINREAYIASHDRLTGLYNRDYLCRRIEQRLQEDPDTEYLIICSDILEFKLVNDIFGKKIGDQILVNTARLMDSLRRPDVLYGRVGGDRFAVMMPKERYNEARFVAGAGDYSQINGEIFYPATIQFGVYEVSDRTLPASIMFDRAFMAIESIKNDLQRRIAYYTDDMRNILLWEQQLTSQLDTAMRDNLIIPYLQPQVDTDGKVEGAEVLCRWDHTPQGIMVPENFIGILERNGMIVKLDYFMWESACKILKKWSLNGKGNFYLSVNISPKDFYFIDVYETIIGLVEKYGIEPERLRLEITETVMMTDSKNKFQLIDRLREHGFIVEMDDFGSGYSSLNMLKDLPVDIIKFDMLFLSHTEHSDRARTILRHLFAMANQLEIPVITEGVETQEQANFLAELGCNMFQGFFFSKPITLEAFEKTYF